MNYILDTNIVLTYVRDTIITQNIENELNLMTGYGERKKIFMMCY